MAQIRLAIVEPRQPLHYEQHGLSIPMNQKIFLALRATESGQSKRTRQRIAQLSKHQTTASLRRVSTDTDTEVTGRRLVRVPRVNRRELPPSREMELEAELRRVVALSKRVPDDKRV